MKWLFLCCSILTVGCTATDESPETTYGPIKGDSLISLGGSWDESRVDASGTPTIDTTIITTTLQYGYFITAAHEVGGQVLFDLFDTNIENQDEDTLELSAYYNYNFRQSSRTWYYVGADLGWRTIDSDALGNSDSAAYGVHVGMRQWLTPQISLFIQPFYKRSEIEVTTDSNADEDRYGIVYGFGFSF